MTDYDPVRTCCSAADICNKCWPFISAAVKVLDKAIRTEYGYEKLLWVYSGRRGIHLWISDKEAMELTDTQRKAVVGWLTVVHGGKDGSKRLNVRTGGILPPSLKYVTFLLSLFTFIHHNPVQHYKNSETSSLASFSTTRISLQQKKVTKSYLNRFLIIK